MYNLVLSGLLLIVLLKEKIILFRFPRQGYYFGFFLFIMFILRAFNGYGKVLLQLPLGLSITDQGLYTSSVFVSYVILIFLAFSLAVYSTDQKEIFCHLKPWDHSQNKVWRQGQRMARIGMYAIYLLPKSLDYRNTVSQKIRTQTGAGHSKVLRKVNIVLENIYQFMHSILKRSEEEFASFQEVQQRENTSIPPALFNFRHAMTAVAILGLHLPLIWNAPS
jgi:hypothetical protein